MFPDVATLTEMLSPVRIARGVGLLFVLLPLATFGWIAATTLLGGRLRERTIARVTAAVYSTLVILALWVDAQVLTQGPFEIALGTWFSTPGYAFPVRFRVDGLTASFLTMTSVLLGIIGRFSATYMHREPGFTRFYALLHLFGTGMSLLELGASIDVIFAGWELVGITSVLLIAFFQHRSAPVKNALRAFVAYRLCDTGFLLAAVAMHHHAHTTDLHHTIALLSETGRGVAATTVAGALLLAALGKSAIFPASGWLPRAMEGPTPSSALFYGALSLHSGVYLILRVAPLLPHAPAVRTILIVLGLVTAFYATVTGRTRPDAKTSLAYASLAQVGLMFAEVGLGFDRLVLVHVACHALLRILQFLQTPSALRANRALLSGLGVTRLRAVAPFEGSLSPDVQRVLYRLGLERFFLDTVLERFLLRPWSHIVDGAKRVHRGVERIFWGLDEEVRRTKTPLDEPGTLKVTGPESPAP